MDHIVWISGRQMHAKGGAQADEGQQRSGPTAVETRQQRQAPDQMGAGIEIHTATLGAGTCTVAKNFAVSIGSRSWRMPSHTNRLDISSRARGGRKTLLLMSWLLSRRRRMNRG